jgi:hypothetical protein
MEKKSFSGLLFDYKKVSMEIDKSFTEIPYDKIVSIGNIINLYNDVFDIHWIPGRFCNYECSYCWPYSKVHDRKEDTVFTEQDYRKAVDRFMDHGKKRGFKRFNLTLSGGEPTIFPHIMAIIDQYLSHKADGIVLKLQMLTNLSRPAKWWGEWISAVQYANDVTLIASWHQGYLTVEEFSDRLIQIKNAGIAVTVNVTFTFDDFESKVQDTVYIQNRGLKVKALPYRDTKGLMPKFKAEHQRILMEEIVASVGKPSKLIEKLPDDWIHCSDINEKDYQVELIDYDGNKYYVDYAERLPSVFFDNYKDWTCWAGYDSIRINEKGTVSRGRGGCTKVTIGNIFDESTPIAYFGPKKCPHPCCSVSTDALVKKVNVDLLMKREKYTGSKSYPSGNYHQPEPQYEPIIFVKK